MAKKKEDLLATIRKRLTWAQDAEADNRKAALEDIKFENGEHWTDAELAERAGRPCLTINKTASTVKQIIGEMRQNKLSIKCRPVDSVADPRTAEILTGLIKNIENISNAEDAYDYAAECAIRGGFGYFRVLTDYSRNDVFDQDVLIKRIVNPFSVHFGPAVEADYSDAKWCIITEKMATDDFEAAYPKALKTASLDVDSTETTDWYSDDGVTVAEYWQVTDEQKRLLLLADGRTVDAADLGDMLFALESMGGIVKERLRTCQKVTWHKVTGSEIIEGPKEWAGQWIPIVPVLGEEVWVEGKRILRSAIRWAKDPNRLYNWARSNAVESLALAPKQPYLATPGQIEGHETQWNESHRKPQPYLLYNESSQGPPQRQPLGLPDSGALQEAMQAADDIKSTTGYFDASLGAQGNEASGRAIIARQKQSNTSTFIFTDNLKRALNHAGRILVDLIPRIYDTERVVRLLNPDGSEGWETINQQDPVTGQKLNDISIGKYDVVIDVGPAYSTRRMEAADGMVQMVQAAPMTAQIIMPRLAKNLDWPEAQEIAEELKALFQPQQQQPDPRQEMAMAKGEQDIIGKQLDNQRKQMQMEGASSEADQRTYQIATQAISDAFRQIGLIPGG
jgi:hypothetical protein